MGLPSGDLNHSSQLSPFQSDQEVKSQEGQASHTFRQMSVQRLLSLVALLTHPTCWVPVSSSSGTHTHLPLLSPEQGSRILAMQRGQARRHSTRKGKGRVTWGGLQGAQVCSRTHNTPNKCCHLKLNCGLRKALGDVVTGGSKAIEKPQRCQPASPGHW